MVVIPGGSGIVRRTETCRPGGWQTGWENGNDGDGVLQAKRNRSEAVPEVLNTWCSETDTAEETPSTVSLS